MKNAIEADAFVAALKSNYAIKPTPELDLRSNRTLRPARLIAALDVRSSGRSRESTEVERKDLLGNDSVLS